MIRYFKMTINHPSYRNDILTDIVAIDGEHSLNLLIAMSRMRPYMRFEEVSNRVAYNMLEHALDGVGIGCYLPLGNDRENRLARMASTLKAQVLKSIMKGFVVERPHPMFPVHKSEYPKPNGRPVLSLVFSG